MKKNATLPIQAREGMAFPRDVPRAAPSGHPSEKPYLPSLGWEDYHNPLSCGTAQGNLVITY